MPNAHETPPQAKVVDNLAERGKWDLLAHAVARGVVNPNLPLPKKTSLLHEAAEWGQVEMVTTLLSRGADVNKATDYGWRSLHAALNDDDDERFLMRSASGRRRVRCSLSIPPAAR